MKVLFQSRVSLFSVPGGDTTQILKTAEALKQRGCHVDVSLELAPDVSDYDIVHLFNLVRPQEAYMQALNAKQQGKKVALSTIYVDYSEYDRKGRAGLAKLMANSLRTDQIEYLKVLARAVKNREANKGTRVFLKHGYRALQNKTVDITDVFLPNSQSEMERVLSDFPSVAQKSYFVVPNGVAPEFEQKQPVSAEFEKYEGCVLCVGRIEGLKGQLSLVQAMLGLPWHLVIVGNPAPNHLRYFKQVQRAAGPNVQILGHVEHRLLPQLYSAAKVHALISWMETTGLSSLEAGALDCNLVITDKGDTRDYFGDHAYYCQPDSIDSIRQAIIKAYEAPVDHNLREHILQNFTWQRAAEKTLEAYEIALRS